MFEACLKVANTTSPRSLSITALALLSTTIFPITAQAQIVPDSTLGDENSTVTEGAIVRGNVADLIEGGAARGGNLFHSFLEFNVDEGQRVYFANPAGIESILSRITGGNPSNIFGTLGVDGTADLFLLNPNGIVFGENADLDIEGSFYASTGNAIGLGNEVFSATEPEQSRLLTVNPSVLFTNYLTDSSGEIENRGQLVVMGDLTLAGNQLDLQGQVAAGGDLTLLALDEVQIRDTAEVPFIGFAGGDLLVQGNEQVDIIALSHPDSGLYSYGDMVLRSANSVGGDAHYWSGGNFRVETLNGEAGNLYSPIDPIIRAFGDVEIEDYLGSSLHILAGGSVTIGTAEITSPDPGAIGVDFLQETIELSDGTIVEVDGGTQPTLDVRAGISPEALGSFAPANITGFDPITDGFFGFSGATDISSTADIMVGDVFITAPDGLVLLTNQYAPNSEITGGNILVTGEGIYGDGINVKNFNGPGGEVFIDSRSHVEVIDGLIDTSATTDVGDIVIAAEGGVIFDDTDGNLDTGAISQLLFGGTGSSGNIRIDSQNIQVSNSAILRNTVLGNGQSGNIIIDVQETARFQGSSPLGDILAIPSGAFTGISGIGSGEGGSLIISARNLEVIDGAQLVSSVRGQGTAGDIRLEVIENARFEGSNPTGDLSSGAFSSILFSEGGEGGNLEITARNLQVKDGAILSASTFGVGDAGDIILRIEETAQFEGSNLVDGRQSGAFSNVQANGFGEGGDVRIVARNLIVRDGSQISSGVFGEGDAGSVILEVEEAARFVGSNAINGSPSGAFSNIEPGGEGTGGNVEIRAQSLEVMEGAELRAATSGKGDAGSVILEVAEVARFVGFNPFTDNPSGAFSSIEPDGEGDGGNVEVRAANLAVLDGAQLSASTRGFGDAGSVILQIAETARFVGANTTNGSASGAFSQVSPGGRGTGGRVEVRANNLEVLDGGNLNALTAGVGNAGDVILEITETARFAGFSLVDGGPSGAFSEIQQDGEGIGGNVEVRARNLDVLDGAQLSASTRGRGNAGNVILQIADTARFVGANFTDGNASGAFSQVSPGGRGTGGRVEVRATNLEVLDGGNLNALSAGFGAAGSVILEIADTARFVGSNPFNGDPSGAFSEVKPGGEGDGGNVEMQASNLEVLQGALLSSQSSGAGNAGDIVLSISDQLLINSGTIATDSTNNSGGQINVQSGSVILRNDGDIQTFVANGTGGGGSIKIAADFVIALEDSDILAFSADGVGGNIDLSQTTLFSQNLNFDSDDLSRSELEALDLNNRVDINATGGIASGQISINDTSFIENSLNELLGEIVNTATLTAGSCIARADSDLTGSFVVTGGEGLPQQPGGDTISAYPTGAVQTPAEAATTPAIQEPQGVYQLTDGRLVLSHECE